MARIRSIKPEFFLSEQVAELPYQWRLLFIGLWTQADRDGRLERRPKRLKAALFPYDNIDVDAGLKALERVGLLVSYVHDGAALIQIPTWRKHQQPHIKELPSVLAPFQHGADTVLAPVSPVDQEGKGADPDQEGECSEPLRDSEPPVLTFPTNGPAKEWHLTQSAIDRWRADFPSLDIVAECRKARAWVEANPSKRKTAKGMPAFLVSWFGRANDRPRTAAPVEPDRIPETTLARRRFEERYGHLNIQVGPPPKVVS